MKLNQLETTSNITIIREIIKNTGYNRASLVTDSDNRNLIWQKAFMSKIGIRRSHEDQSGFDSLELGRQTVPSQLCELIKYSSGHTLKPSKYL